MRDLNTLIAPGSGFQLTIAFNINDRGEILAKAAPIGFTPNDDEDLGHLVLLVPCHDEDVDCGVRENTDNGSTSLAPASMRNSTTSESGQRKTLGDHQRSSWHQWFGRRNNVPAQAPKN